MLRRRLVHIAWGCLFVLASGTPLRGQDEAAQPLAREHIYGHKDGMALTLDAYAPMGKPNGAAVAFIVSGGWHSRWAPPESLLLFLQPYRKSGYRVFAIRHGSSPRYGIADAVADVQRGVRYLRQNAEKFEFDPERLGVMGMSAGGHLSLMLATTGEDGDPASGDPLRKAGSRVRAAVALVPPTNLEGVVWSAPNVAARYKAFAALDISQQEAKEVSPLTHVTPDDAPSLVIMGAEDDLVPPDHGRWIHAKFDEESVANKLIVYEGADHGLKGSQQEALREAQRWFDQRLLSPKE